MSIRFFVLGLSFLAMLLAGVSAANASNKSGGHLYAVIFGILADENDKITSIRVVEVIDPATGSISPVPVKPAETYVVAAEKTIRAKGYKARFKEGKPTEFFTYFFYDPAQPDRIDIDPTAKK